MARGKKPRGTILAQINITPMVDVMLVVLVIFMVTAPLAKKGVDVELPNADAKSLPSDENKLIVKVDSKGQVYLDEKKVALESLEDEVRHNPRALREQEIYIHADKSLRYGLIIKVMAAVQRAGISRMGLITHPLKE